MINITREISILKNIKGGLIALFIYPLLIAFMLFSIFHEEKITQLPIAIVDQDNSLTSQKIIHSLSAIQEIEVTPSYKFPNLDQAKETLLKTQTYGVIYIPHNFEQNMLAGNSPELTTFYNNQFMTTGGTINRAVYTGLSSILIKNQIDNLMARGIPQSVAEEQVSPISLSLHPVFNPTLNFIYTLVNGVYPAIIQILIMMLITASMQHEWSNRGNFIRFCQLNQFSIIKFFISKASIYIALFLGFFLLFDATLTAFFNLHLAGSLTLLIVGEILFIIASISMAMAISFFVPNKFRNYGFVGVLSSPAFGFTGLIYPQLAMNLFAQIWGSILPISWFINIRLNQSLRGTEFINSYGSYLALLVIIIISLSLCQFKLSWMKKKVGIEHA